MTAPANRRPLRSRHTAWAAWLARKAVRQGLSPNRISQGSLGFAVVGAAFFALSPHVTDLQQTLCLALAAVAIQARLLCNLLDGLVAIEGGRAAKDGPFWNEAPDRAADLLFLGAAGLAAGQPWLGLLAGALAVSTAYLRELGRAEGLPPDFSGPMAKPQRMAALTVGAVIAAFAAPDAILTVTLAIIAIGTAATTVRRSARLMAALRER